MGQFLGGLFCMVVGFFITLILLAVTSTTFATASFWIWLPTIIGVLLGVIIWTGGELDFFDVFI